jgi:hypothetical protein
MDGPELPFALVARNESPGFTETGRRHCESVLPGLVIGALSEPEFRRMPVDR